MEGEVTRVEAVTYLMGASGHGALSTLFLLLWGLLVALGEWSLGIIVLVIAAGVSLNGLSLFVWDRLNERAATSTDRADTASDRTLRPYSPSPEMRAELLAGFVIVAGFVTLLTLVLFTLRALGGRTGIYLTAAVLLAGNVAGLGRWYLTTVR